MDRPVPSDTMAFSLDLLSGARTNAHPLTVCPDGHLVLSGRNHYTPVRLTEDFKSLVFDKVPHGD